MCLLSLLASYKAVCKVPRGASHVLAGEETSLVRLCQEVRAPHTSPCQSHTKSPPAQAPRGAPGTELSSVTRVWLTGAPLGFSGVPLAPWHPQRGQDIPVWTRDSAVNSPRVEGTGSEFDLCTGLS